MHGLCGAEKSTEQSLWLSDVEMHREMARAGALQTVLSAMQANTSSVEVQMEGCGVLINTTALGTHGTMWTRKWEPECQRLPPERCPTGDSSDFTKAAADTVIQAAASNLAAPGLQFAAASFMRSVSWENGMVLLFRVPIFCA